MRVELGDGNWAELRTDVDRIPNGDRKRVMRRYNATPDGWERIYEFNEGLISLLVTAWSYDLPLPSEKPEILDEIPAYDYDRLVHAMGELGVNLFLSFDPQPDVSSPTEPSGE